MLTEHNNRLLLLNPTESRKNIDAPTYIPYRQEKTRVQLDVIFKTRVVPERFENKSSLVGTVEKGCYHRVSHNSTCNHSKMTFGIFIPSSYVNDPNLNYPVLLFLGGLTFDDANFASKAGQRTFEAAERQGVAIVIPDTSRSRGPEDVHDDAGVYHHIVGVDASLYNNATAQPYNVHYQMYEYIMKELPAILENNFNIGKNGLKSICGHNMGEHVALTTIALREGIRSWKSVSVLASICNSTQCGWGQMAFDKYFIFPEEDKMHDEASCFLLASLDCSFYDEMLIDQGSADLFMQDQLKPFATIAAAEECSQKGSYFFVAKFIEDHVRFHAKRLRNSKYPMG